MKIEPRSSAIINIVTALFNSDQSTTIRSTE